MTTINLEAPEVNFVIDQGSDFEYTIQLLDTNNVPKDLTGYDLRFQVRKDSPNGERLINGTLANGKIVWVNQALGTFKILITGATSAALQFFGQDELETFYDIEVIDPFLSPKKSNKGTMTFMREVTR